jgi:membrane-bound ClpP family serine protease
MFFAFLGYTRGWVALILAGSFLYHSNRTPADYGVVGAALFIFGLHLLYKNYREERGGPYDPRRSEDWGPPE